jgi:hypothetical protein
LYCVGGYNGRVDVRAGLFGSGAELVRSGDAAIGTRGLSPCRHARRTGGDLSPPLCGIPAWIFGVYIDGKLASSIRLHAATKTHPELPALGVFADLLAPEISRGKIVIDPTRFVADRAASRRHPELCYVTTRLAVLGSEYFRANLLLATVRAEHQAFYRRVFGHRLICEPRPYPSLSKPISLMALDYPMARERLWQRHVFLRSTVFERRMLFGRAAQGAAALRRPAA